MFCSKFSELIEIGDCDEMADRIGGGVLRPGDYVLMISDGQIIGGERVTDNTPPEMLLPAMQDSYPGHDAVLAEFTAEGFAIRMRYRRA